MDSDILPQRKTFADFAHQERVESNQTKKKRVHFENEVPEGTTTTGATEAATENPEMLVHRPSAEGRYDPTADDIDTVTVQEE
ncbi:hypothetical protein PHMEG_0008441 [Phytophthora megakarya]|uniref:Uncharacterized protein n=1 Tax=Phytophthora megakarya TaxID=4795 RepID=A0A225WJK8_9STRA|nr:hypothetical protein PHMEG_0008441 [Phytophthora megakarya]